MAEERDGKIDWFSPDPRAIQPFLEGDPLGSFHLKRSLARQVRKKRFDITSDQCCARVVNACATVPRPAGAGTWINREIEEVFDTLHDQGFAHSVEAWLGSELVGGIYGVTIGGAFFGESMFSTEPYASQVCYVWLIEHLRKRGYKLFDVQFTNPHIEQFGVVEIPIDTYLGLLEQAVLAEIFWQDD